MKTIQHFLFGLLLSGILASCATSLYDHFTLTETLAIKAQASALVATSTQAYNDHVLAVEELQSQLEKMVSYETAKSNNAITLQMWKYLQSDESALQGFLKLWREQGTLGPTFTEEFQPQIEKAFDILLDYETKKDKETANILTALITG
ncbi:hypothetical protein [Croceiramulus getboli]|nr:hypothetical protein P8624_10095 [Flavobacteriaceae bacterium YJPT1-3]